MARILVNYIYNKEQDKYEILKGTYVFADMQVAVLETELSIKKPLVVPIKNTATVVDRDEYESAHKRFYLIADNEGKVSESSEGSEVWLPKDTNINDLRYINGQLVMVQHEEKPEKVSETKPSKKRVSKEA